MQSFFGSRVYTISENWKFAYLLVCAQILIEGGWR